MKLKLAAIALIASVALNCDTSFGCDLLDRMLGRAGCSSCQAPKAPSCGCGGGGLMDKIMSKAAGCECGGSDMLIYDENMTCGPVGSPCGASVADCGCSAPAGDCGCGAPASPASRCDGGGCGLFSKVRGGLGGGCGCETAAPTAAPVADCGCSAPAPAPVADCGCDAVPASPCGDGGCGLFSKVRGNLGGGCGCEAAAPVADCGCSAPAPVVDCGCDAAPASSCGEGGCGLFSKIRGNMDGGCGCEAAAPVADCGCGSPAPAVSSCGCNAPVSGGHGSAVAQCGARGKLTLLDRLRGNRIPRTREGVVIGSCNNGCNSPCPQQPTHGGGCGCNAPTEAAPCTSCGEATIVYGDAQPYDGGCSTCQGSSQGQIIGGAVAAPTTIDSNGETNIAPVVPGGSSNRNETEGVIETGVKEAMKEAAGAVEGASPVVDPGAFIPSRRSTVGS